MPNNGMQTNRFELKYLVSEGCARSLRDFVRSYLVPDEHVDPHNNFSYAIHSLYLDGPDLPLYRATMQGHKNRFKLRIRYYDDRPENPVFFEIKRRVNDVILKSRAMVKRSSVHRLLAGYGPDYSDLHKPNDMASWEALSRFMYLARQIRAEGRVIVSYLREAWVTTFDNSVRFTMDRCLTATRYEGDLVVADFLCGMRPPIRGVIVEIKFTDRFPDWLRDLVRAFNLQRLSMAKYIHCLQAIHLPEGRISDLVPLGVPL